MENLLQIKTKCKINLVLQLILIAIFFVLAGSKTTTAAALLQQKTISIKLRNATIKSFLLELNKQHGFEVVYSNSDIQDETKKITANYDNVTVERVLSECLNGTKLKYRIENNSLIIYKEKPKTEPLKSGQRSFIQGTVLGENKKPIAGATIILVGSSMGAISEANGNFSLMAELGQEVEITYVGYKPKILKLSTKNFTIQLEVEAMAAGEVIVTGYGSVRKESFTGNVTSVDTKDLLRTNNKNAIAALQAFDPSFRLKENAIWGSDPNRLPEFNIRGESSIGMKKGLDVEMDKRTQRTTLQDNPNLPIFILDGFEVSVQKIYDMDINRIENMTILKDAAATAMYGSRASNGVIIVTSVAPKPGELTVNYILSGGAEFPDLSDYNLCNAAEKLEVEKGAGLYTSKDPTLQVHRDQEYLKKLNLIRRGVDTDWMAIPLRNVFNHTHSLSLSGGVESIRYSIDLNYDSNNGAMKDSHRRRSGVGLSLDFRQGKWLQLRNKVSFNNTSSQDSPYGNFSNYTKLQPYNEIYDENGNLMPRLVDGVTVNPLWVVENTKSYYGKTGLNDLTNNFMMNIYMMQGFSFKAQFSLTRTDSNSETFNDPNDPIYSTKRSSERGELSMSGRTGFNWNGNALFYFNKSIKGHFINATAGIEAMQNTTSNSSTKYRGFQLGSLNKPAFAAEQADKTGYDSSKSRMFSFITSLNYSFNDIYLLDASFRADGSSQFGENNRFANFWSTGIGLNIHKYSWMENVTKVINTLKLRATFGSTGNVSFPSYSAVTTYAMSSDSWYYTGPAASLIYLGNPGLTWETTKTFDTGIQMAFLQDRITLDVSYYNKKTSDLIDEVTIRQSSGFEKYYSNTGSIVNKGYEVKLGGTAYKDRNWVISINANINGNKNRITSLGKDALAYNQKLMDNYNAIKPEYGDLVSVPLIQYYVGASTTAIYAVPSYGIDPSNGKEKFRKKNGTSTYIWTAEDQIVVGDNSPTAQGSFGLNLAYKGFYLNTTFLFQWGSQTYNETLLNKVENAQIETENVDKRVLTQRWKKPGDLAPYYDLKSNAKTNPTSRFVQDYNFLNLSGISCGYDFKPELIKKLKLKSLGLRFNMNEVVRFSSVKEERGTSYPYAKNYSFTVNIGF